MLGDAIMFGISKKGSSSSHINAAWCDWDVNELQYFICEGLIE